MTKGDADRDQRPPLIQRWTFEVSDSLERTAIRFRTTCSIVVHTFFEQHVQRETIRDISIINVLINRRRVDWREMKFFFFLGGALKSRLSGCWSDSRDRRCAEQMRPFLSLFKLCGIFANVIDNGQLKRCPRSFYGVGVFWISAYVSYVCFLLHNYLTVDATVRITVDFAKHFIGFASLSVNVWAAYTSQNHFAKVRETDAVCEMPKLWKFRFSRLSLLFPLTVLLSSRSFSIGWTVTITRSRG